MLFLNELYLKFVIIELEKETFFVWIIMLSIVILSKSS